MLLDGNRVATQAQAALDWFGLTAARGDGRGCRHHAPMLVASQQAEEALGWMGRAGEPGRRWFRAQMRTWLVARPVADTGIDAPERSAARC